MNAAKLKALIVFGVILLLGSGVLVFAGLAMESAASERLNAAAAEFSSSIGLTGSIAREPKLEGGSVGAAYSLKAQGAISGYVLYLECRGFSGKAGFLSAYAASGAFRAARPVAVTDASLVSGGWPREEVLRAAIAPKDGATPSQGGAEYEIVLRNLGIAIYEGQTAIERRQGGRK